LLLLQVFFVISSAATITVLGLYDFTPMQTTQQDILGRGLIAFSAALAVGLSGLAAGIAIASAGAAAVTAITEKSEAFAGSFLVVALAEALAIYGLIIGILLWLKM